MEVEEGIGHTGTAVSTATPLYLQHFKGWKGSQHLVRKVLKKRACKTSRDNLLMEATIQSHNLKWASSHMNE
jgi:hypothetical protein